MSVGFQTVLRRYDNRRRNVSGTKLPWFRRSRTVARTTRNEPSGAQNVSSMNDFRRPYAKRERFARHY